MGKSPRVWLSQDGIHEVQFELLLFVKFLGRFSRIIFWGAFGLLIATLCVIVPLQSVAVMFYVCCEFECSVSRSAMA